MLLSRRLPPFPLLVANLLAPTARVERNGHAAYRLQLPRPGEARFEGLRRSGGCMAAVLEVDRAALGLDVVLADDQWPTLLDRLRQDADRKTRHAWVEGYLRLMLALEQIQPWMAQLPFRPEHLEVQGARMRLSVAGVAWLVNAPIRLQAHPLRSAAELLDTIGSFGPVAESWRTSTRVSLTDALADWCDGKPRARHWPLLAVSAVLAMLAVPLTQVHQPVARPSSHVQHPGRAGRPHPVVAHWLKQFGRLTVRSLSTLPTLPSWPASPPLDLAQHRLVAADLAGRSACNLTLLRNEIYARHGRPFQDVDLHAWFTQQPWYHPDPAYRDGCLSIAERENAAFILDWQTQHHLTW